MARHKRKQPHQWMTVAGQKQKDANSLPQHAEHLQGVVQRTAAALYDIGYRDEQDSTERHDICVCNVDSGWEDQLIRCSNRLCRVEVFHLRCVNLPEHPPLAYQWSCSQCIELAGWAHVNGLIDTKGGDLKAVQAWLVDARRLQAIRIQREQVEWATSPTFLGLQALVRQREARAMTLERGEGHTEELDARTGEEIQRHTKEKTAIDEALSSSEIDESEANRDSGVEVGADNSIETQSIVGPGAISKAKPGEGNTEKAKIWAWRRLY